MNNKIYDVVLVSPPSRMINHYRPPLALLYLAGYLRYKGMKVKIIDIPMKEVIRNKEFYKNINHRLKNIEKEMIKEFKKIKTRTVGITFYTPEYSEVFSLAKAYKKIDPKIKIITGGIHPTLFPEEILEDKSHLIDFTVIGEGEITLYELVKAIKEDKKNYQGIDGIAYCHKKTGKIIKTNLRLLHKNLDEISYPAYDLIDMDYYTNASPYAIRGCFLRSMYLLATRGCPSQCTFCVAKNLKQHNGGGQYVRTRSAKNLVDELIMLKAKYKIDSFYFIDDLFTINKKNVVKFCQLLSKQQLNLLWGCSSKVSTIDENVIKNMSKAGCIQIDFGVERGSDEALKIIKKGINLSIIKKTFYLCHRYGIRTFANFLVNLPGETKKDLLDIINLMDKLNSEIVSLNIFTPYPGTEIYNTASFKFTKKEYSLLTNAPALIDSCPKKFKFAKHNINLLKWTSKYHKTHNKLSNNLRFYFDKKYLLALMHSQNKINYLNQSIILIKELINQKFS